MKILLIQIDKTQDSYILQGIELYAGRLRNYCQIETLTINMNKSVRQRSQPEQKAEERKQILNNLLPEDHVVLLDERGKELTSEGFSRFIAQKQNASIKRLVFVIGGPFGFDEQIYNRADYKLSLSQMTFSHQMVRLFFMEQLYRAYTIIKGEKYHHS
jgi:23S rRNA (pseudouridine1915-N3)-methyltransferase